MVGRRRPDNTAALNLLSGEYSYQTWTTPPCWFIRDPKGDIGTLGEKHTVIEHEDGTITVTPSIVNTRGNHYHGFLERGIWRETP
jgi:hypothetical protein